MSMPGEGGARRVVLHVGSPKTGTTFLQNVLWSQRAIAREQGLLLPMERFNDHYLASLDLRGLSRRPIHPPRAIGMWDRIVGEVADWSGTALVSHELFAAATAEQAAAGVESLQAVGSEVHVVVTARDLVRQVAAEWQEHVKHRSTKTFAEFVAEVREDDARTGWFWKVQDFASVLERWGAGLPPEQVHVVTVPLRGTSSELLWGRFASLLGVDPGAFNTDLPRSNTSLGAEQAELLRRVNLELGERLPLPGPYPLVVKNVLAHRILEKHPGTRLALAPDDAKFAVAESRSIADRLAASGIDVVGDLEELVPEAASAVDEDAYRTPDAETMLADSVSAIADLLVVLNERRRVQRRAEDMASAAQETPIRFALVQAARTRPLLGRAHGVYRRLRGKGAPAPEA